VSPEQLKGRAAVEFQRILDHSGIVWNCWTGALAHLGVARANALQAKNSQGADADAARARARWNMTVGTVKKSMSAIVSR
jgi:hypothetical protein